MVFLRVLWFVYIFKTLIYIIKIIHNFQKVDKTALEAWMNHLSSQSRASQILSSKDNPLIYYFRDAFSRYLRDVKITYAVPDKRDPDFQFYEVTKGTMNVYR